MAEENEAATEEGAEEAEVKKKKLDIKALLIPIISSMVTAGIVGAVVAIFLAPKPQMLPQEAEQNTEQTDSLLANEQLKEADTSGQTGIFHNYDPFVVSIFDREKVHYLKVMLSLELSNEKVKDDINAKNPQIRDAMIFVLSDFTLRELLDNQAKNLLKEVMVKTLNGILGKGKVINIYFTEFTLQ